MPNTDYLLDRFLSPKVFDFNTYRERGNEEENINIRIKNELYKNINYNPVYFQGESTSAALDFFVAAEEFKHFKSDLLKIKQYLLNWLNKYPLIVEVPDTEFDGLAFTSVSARSVINEFFVRLTGDYYLDQRAHLYAGGKKNLEILSILLHDEHINIDTRKAILSSLLSDEGLLACAEGCYVRLSDSVNYLTTNLNTKKSFTRWVYDYLFEIADTLMQHEMLNEKKTYLQILCELVDSQIEIMQIHARSYLFLYAVNVGKFPFNIPDDEYVKFFEKNPGANFVAEIYLSSLKKAITSRKLRIYILNKIYNLLKEDIASNDLKDYAGLSNSVTNHLNALGRDEYFELREVFSEDGAIKDSQFFEMTILERLLQSGWFNNDRVFLPETDKPHIVFYKLFQDDWLLTWIKKTGDTRIRLTDIEINEETLEDIKNFWHLFVTNKNLKSLICCAPVILCGYSGPHLYFPTRLFYYFVVYKGIKVFKEWDLQSVCLQKYCFREKLDRSDEIFKKVRLNFLRKLDFSYVTLTGSILRDLDFSEAKFIGAKLKLAYLENILFKSSDLSGIDLNMAHLSHVDFYKANLRRARLRKIWGDGVNFMHADLSSEIIKVDLKYSTFKNTNFVSSNLEAADLSYARFIHCDFTFANLNMVDFSHSNLEGSIFTNTILKTTKLLNANMRGVDLEGADLENVNLANINFQESKLINANLRNTLLQNAKLNDANLAGADLSGANLTGADLAGANLLNANLEGVDLADANLVDAELYNSNFEKNYISSLTSDNLPNQPILNQAVSHDPIVTESSDDDGPEENLEFATIFHKNYAYALKKTDMELIAEIFFRNEEKYFFQVIAENTELTSAFNLFNQHKNIKNCGIFIIKQGKDHWASLVIYFHLTSSNEFSIYFIDSLGEALLSSTQRFIQDFYPRATCIQLLGSKSPTILVYNSGLWSLEISIQLKHIIEHFALSKEYLQSSSSIGFLKEKLCKKIDSFGKNYFENQRISFAIQLLKEPNRKQKFKELVNIAYSKHEVKSESNCLPKITKRAISVNGCPIDWHDIDKINLELLDKRNVNKIKIDSILLLDLFEHMTLSKRSQMLRWIYENNVQIVGNKELHIRMLITMNKMIPDLFELRYISERLNVGLFMDGTIAATVKMDTQSFARNLGFIASNVFFSHLAEIMDLRGATLLQEDKLLLGMSLKSSVPFIRRGTSVFFAYDLYNQIKLLQDENRAVIPDIAVGGFMLGADIVQIGIELAEIAEVESVLAVAGPIGLFIDGTIIFVIVGSRLYQAVDAVSQIDHIIPLTGFEKFKQSWRAFLSLGLEDYIKELIDVVQANNQLLLAKLEILKSQPHIAHYFYVPIEKVNCNTQHSNCSKPGSYFYSSDADLCRKQSGLKWARGKPEKPVGIEFTCLPSGNYESAMQDTYYCRNLVGFTNITNQIADVAFFDLEDGSREVHAFANKKNLFFFRNGFVSLYGGNQDDFFMILASSVEGQLSGGLGRDTLDLSEFFPLERNIILDLTKGLLTYGQKKQLSFKDIEVFIGRKAHSEAVKVACNTSELNMQGSLFNNEDIIVIPQRENCDYSLKVILHANTLVSNQALSGNFEYIILPGYGLITVNLTFSYENNTHQFFLNGTLNDLASISVRNAIQAHNTLGYDTMLRFVSASTQELIQLIKSIQIFKTQEKPLAEINYSFNALTSVTSIDVLQKARCLPVELTSQQYSHFLENYFDQSPMAFNITLSDRQEVHNSILNLLTRVACPYPIEDTTITINSISRNNVYFYFSDGSTLQIGGEDNIYVHMTMNQTMEYIRNLYLDSAKRLNITFSAYSEMDNASLIAGHNKSEVMRIHHFGSKSYFIANGGENIFVVDTGYERLVMLNQLPIREIIIDSEYSKKYIDTIDFRPLFSQVKIELNKTVEIELKINTQELEFENDVFIMPRVKNPTNITDSIDLFSIRLKNALLDKNYEAIQFILNVAPMQIRGSVSHLYAEPVPLEFGVYDNIVVLSIYDVEKNTLVIFNKLFNGHEFIREKDHLFISNILSRKLEEKAISTLFLTDFYKQPILSTLKIKFFNTELVLKDKLHQINKAREFTELYAREVKKIEAFFNQTGLFFNHQSSIFYINLNNSLARNLSHDNQIISRQRRSIRWIEDPIITNDAGRLQEMLPNLRDDIYHPTHVTERKLTSAGTSHTGILQEGFKTVSSTLNYLFSNKFQHTRQRSDSTQERADAYYDRLDRTKVRSKKHKKNKFVKGLSEQAYPAINDVSKQSILVENQAKHALPAKMNKSNFIDHKQQSVSTTRVGTSKPIQTFIQQNSGRNNKSTYINNNQSPVKIGTPMEAWLFKGIEYKHGNFSRLRSLAQGKLVGHHYNRQEEKPNSQQHTHQKQDRPRLLRVTASGDVTGTFLLLNVLVRKYSGVKYKPCPIPKVVAKRPQVHHLLNRPSAKQENRC